MTIELCERTSQVSGGRAHHPSLPTLAPPSDDVLGRIGRLETCLARSPAEIAAAQALRYRVFAEELGAPMPAEAMRHRRDVDGFDAFCDHLLVIDRSLDGGTEVVGTYRLLRQEVARRNGGFYSASEFAVDDMAARHPQCRFLELGRSCVLPAYRTKRTVTLLWQGIWAYALRHGIDAMFGCGSFRGVRPEAHALALSFLHHNARAKGAWSVEALPELARNMDLMPAEAVNPRLALSVMPPLVKGYLRLGATFGTGAVVDRTFGTTDVMVVLPKSAISGRYVDYYGADASRFGA